MSGAKGMESNAKVRNRMESNAKVRGSSVKFRAGGPSMFYVLRRQCVIRTVGEFRHCLFSTDSLVTAGFGSLNSN